MSKRYILNGVIEFSPEDHQLSAYEAKGPAVKLNIPVSRCLELLIERRYTLVPHQVFYTYVWGAEGASVPANSLYQNIALLRKALKTFQEDGDKIINTVPKQGFSLHENVSVQEVDGGKVIIAPPHSLPVSTIVIDKKSISDPAIPLSSEKVVRHGGGRFKYTLFAGIVVLLGLMVFQLTKWGYPSSLGYLAKYTEKTTVSGCQVFTNHIVQNVAMVKENLADNQIDCTKTPYIYMTGFQYSQQTSLLSCEQPLRGATAPKCFVNNNVRNNKK